MKFFHKAKDGGSESSVTGYWLFESKRLGSIVLLRFDGQSREAYHTHAFHCINWVLKGRLVEHMLDGRPYLHKASWLPFFVGRRDFHMVHSQTPRTWVLSCRGPWVRKWCEYLPATKEIVVLTNGRKVVERFKAE